MFCLSRTNRYQSSSNPPRAAVAHPLSRQFDTAWPSRQLRAGTSQLLQPKDADSIDAGLPSLKELGRFVETLDDLGLVIHHATRPALQRKRESPES
jgi:hypothetical protein